VRSRASFNFQYPLHSWNPFTSCLCVLPCLPLTFIFNNVFRRQFLRKMWPIQLAFLLCIVCPSSWLHALFLHTSHQWSNGSSPFFSTTIFQHFPDDQLS
jgi:hypothetical protein